MEKGNQWCVSTSRPLWVFCTEVTVGLHTRDAAVEETHNVPPATAWLGCWWASPTWRGECEPFLSVCLSICHGKNDSVSKCQSTNTYYCEHSTTSMASTRTETTHGCASSIGSTAAVITCLLQGALVLHIMRFYAVHMSAIASETTNGVAGANSCVRRILMCRNLHATTKEIPSHTGKPSREGWVIWVRFVWLSTLGRMSTL